MKVKVNWRKTVDGTTEINTDSLDGFDEYAATWGAVDRLVVVKSFLEDGNPDIWTSMIHRNDEHVGSEDYEIDSVDIT